jgi:hypothetical protein
VPALTIEPTSVDVPYSNVKVGTGSPSTPLTLNVTVIEDNVVLPLTTGAEGATVGAYGPVVVIAAETVELIEPSIFVATATK